MITKNENPVIDTDVFFYCCRFGYSSSGALSITGFSPLMVAPPAFPITPAYWLKCSATKLDKKDVLGKSGILIILPILLLLVLTKYL